jgi:hypothetical protein
MKKEDPSKYDTLGPILKSITKQTCYKNKGVNVKQVRTKKYPFQKRLKKIYLLKWFFDLYWTFGRTSEDFRHFCDSRCTSNGKIVHIADIPFTNGLWGCEDSGRYHLCRGIRCKNIIDGGNGIQVCVYTATVVGVSYWLESTDCVSSALKLRTSISDLTGKKLNDNADIDMDMCHDSDIDGINLEEVDVEDTLHEEHMEVDTPIDSFESRLLSIDRDMHGELHKKAENFWRGFFNFNLVCQWYDEPSHLFKNMDFCLQHQKTFEIEQQRVVHPPINAPESAPVVNNTNVNTLSSRTIPQNKPNARRRLMKSIIPREKTRRNPAPLQKSKSSGDNAEINIIARSTINAYINKMAHKIDAIFPGYCEGHGLFFTSEEEMKYVCIASVFYLLLKWNMSRSNSKIPELDAVAKAVLYMSSSDYKITDIKGILYLIWPGNDKLSKIGISQQMLEQRTRENSGRKKAGKKSTTRTMSTEKKEIESTINLIKSMLSKNRWSPVIIRKLLFISPDPLVCIQRVTNIIETGYT